MKLPLPLLFLLAFSVFASIPQIQATTETQYFRADAIGGFPFLSPVESAEPSGEIHVISDSNVSIKMGVIFGVYYHNNSWAWLFGNSTSPCAVVVKSSESEEYLNASIDVVFYDSVRGDYEVFDYYFLYWDYYTSAWAWFNYWGYMHNVDRLDNATWTVVYDIRKLYFPANKTSITFYWGDSSCSSRVEDIQFDSGVTEEDSEFPVGLGAGAVLMGFVAVVAFTIKKRR